jgi:hypothetical protein
MQKGQRESEGGFLWRKECHKLQSWPFQTRNCLQRRSCSRRDLKGQNYRGHFGRKKHEKTSDFKKQESNASWEGESRQALVVFQAGIEETGIPSNAERAILEGCLIEGCILGRDWEPLQEVMESSRQKDERSGGMTRV